MRFRVIFGAFFYKGDGNDDNIDNHNDVQLNNELYSNEDAEDTNKVGTSSQEEEDHFP